MNASRLFSTVSLLAVVILFGATASNARADTMSLDSSVGSYTLTLTELSSTSLTYTYLDTDTNAPGPSTFSIQNVGPDSWIVMKTSGTVIFNTFTADWIEPENSREVNEVTNNPILGGSSNLYVFSDESFEEYQGGTTTLQPDGTPVLVGSDGAFQVFLKFVDQAQGPEGGTGVPDRGSSLSFLAMSIAGLAALSRFCKVRLA